MPRNHTKNRLGTVARVPNQRFRRSLGSVSVAVDRVRFLQPQLLFAGPIAWGFSGGIPVALRSWSTLVRRIALASWARQVVPLALVLVLARAAAAAST